MLKDDGRLIYRLSLKNNVAAILPTLIGVLIILFFLIFEFGFEDMQKPILILLILGPVPTLILHFDYLKNDYGLEVVIDIENNRLQMMKFDKQVDYDLDDVVFFEKVESAWHLLPFSSYFYYVIHTKSGTSIKFTCLSASNIPLMTPSIRTSTVMFPLCQ